MCIRDRLCSLEVLDEQGNLKRKADMFTRRTIRPHVAVTSVDTASEALAVSISEKARVDMEYMAELSGKSPEELEKELAGVIYRDIRCAENPEDILPSLADLGRYPFVTADEYLSGKVRQKRRMAKAFLEAAPAEDVYKRQYLDGAGGIHAGHHRNTGEQLWGAGTQGRFGRGPALCGKERRGGQYARLSF